MRRSLRLPIILAIVMIALLVVLTVGWSLMPVFRGKLPGWFWAIFVLGATFLVVLLFGVVAYLVLSIKAINLTRRQSNFIDSVTHELKSPITSMKLYLQTLRSREVGPPEQADFYRFMLEDVERLDHLINQMLDAGRLESASVDGEAEDVDLAGLLHNCAEEVCLSYRLPRETVRIEAEPTVVRARRTDLRMIFRNLLDNAVKYAGAEPEVAVTLGPAADGGTLTRVADNGCGIPPALRRKIFGRFVRIGYELERERPGTGLGLYIVRTLLKRLKGRIRVRDRPGGPGTVFEVYLPDTTGGGKEPETKQV
jgi:two-component system, OmpR family, phosphate regulon sensor histidine kinase PhoR